MSLLELILSSLVYVSWTVAIFQYREQVPTVSQNQILTCHRPYDSAYAVKQIEFGHKSILQRTAFSPMANDTRTGEALEPIALDGKNHPRIITLGGDHTITLPLLRSINSVYGPISVIHFDSHLGMISQQCLLGNAYCCFQTHGNLRCSAVRLPTQLQSTTERTFGTPPKKASSKMDLQLQVFLFYILFPCKKSTTSCLSSDFYFQIL